MNCRLWQVPPSAGWELTLQAALVLARYSRQHRWPRKNHASPVPTVAALALTRRRWLGQCPHGHCVEHADRGLVCPPEAPRDELTALKNGTDRPFNVNYFCHSPPHPAGADIEASEVDRTPPPGHQRAGPRAGRRHCRRAGWWLIGGDPRHWQVHRCCCRPLDGLQRDHGGGGPLAVGARRWRGVPRRAGGRCARGRSWAAT